MLFQQRVRTLFLKTWPDVRHASSCESPKIENMVTSPRKRPPSSPEVLRSVSSSRVNTNEKLSEISRICERIYRKVLSHKDAGGHFVTTLFMELPSRKEYPDYYKVITDPIELTSIGKKIERNTYSDLNAFRKDFELLVSNAKTYNERDSDIYYDAVEIQRAFREAYKVEMKNLKKAGKPDLSDENMPADTRIYMDKLEVRGQMYNVGDFVRVKAPGETKTQEPSIMLLDQLWKTPSGKKEFRGIYFYHMPQTFHSPGRKFFEKEVFRTTHVQEMSVEHLLETCYVMFIKDYVRGRPQGIDEQSIYVCESRYNERQKIFTKIKDWESVISGQNITEKLPMIWFDHPIVPKKIHSVFASESEELEVHSPTDSKSGEKRDRSEIEDISPVRPVSLVNRQSSAGPAPQETKKDSVSSHQYSLSERGKP